ncbi:MAG: hypothetical protein ACRCZS_20915 [Chroococcidiopsis sp.]
MKLFVFNSTSITEIYCLTSVIEVLQAFQDFEPSVRRSAIALYSSELASMHGWQQSTAELHLYAIAFHAGLEVAQ